MDAVVENITIDAWAVNDILSCYADKRSEYFELFDIVKGVDLSKPDSKVPFQIYVDICNWIEHKLGRFNLIKAGRRIGESTYKCFIENGMVNENSKPIEIMQALVDFAKKGVHDPKKRGWEIVSSNEKSIVMRKTQLFNKHIQIGLLDSLIRKAKVFGVQVNLVKEQAKGDEFDEYLISWL